MATANLISVEDYLETSYRPDREYVDGLVVERNLGEYDHSNLQGALTTFLRNRQREWNIRVLPEQRVRVSPKRVRIPDVCIISRDQPIEPVITHPPLVCIEVVSREDRIRYFQDKVDEYITLGVPAIWLFDPAKRLAYVCTREGFLAPEGGILTVPGTPIQVPLNDLFADLD
ncbi:MAG TPA: Uma2 family endonuclease [Bryobacteraceae bacterium]|nr:Uma2 family endonuclease [Bryobacteraceae bacterium]